MKYVIKLPKQSGYLCHAGTNRVVIYDSATSYPIGMDVMACNGEREALEGDTFHDVFVSGWYDNKIDEIEDPVESLLEYKGHHRVKEDATVYM
jgi:hypothetical protein